MTKSTLASKYKSLMVRKSHKKSIIAVAHKMIRLIYILLSRRQAYIDQAIDYRRDECEEERAALDQAAQGHRPLAVAQTRRSQRLIRR